MLFVEALGSNSAVVFSLEGAEKWDYDLYSMLAPYVAAYMAQKSGILFSFLVLPFFSFCCKLLHNLFIWCSSQ